MQEIRVLQLLSDEKFKKKLIKFLPKECLLFSDQKIPKHNYPKKLIDALPNKYSDFGIATESLLKENEINIESLKKCLEIEIDEKIYKLKSIENYLLNVKNTRDMLLKKAKNKDLIYNVELEMVLNNNVLLKGHPDLLSEDKIYEVKTSGNLTKSWLDYLLQVFIYSILYKETKKLYLVLPLQEFIWSYKLKNWTTKDKFIELIKNYKIPEIISEEINMERHILRNMLYSSYNIGSHVSKLPSLVNTVLKMTEYPKVPYQIFLSMKSYFKISDEDVSMCYEIVKKNKLKVYVHSPYILNLAMDSNSLDNYVVGSLQYHLKISASCGFRGVVVHTGKSTHQKLEDALVNMKNNVLMSIESASEKCPLLIETGSGAGTEMLTTVEDLLGFISDIDDKRLGLCVDTCHVFSTNYLPDVYLEKVLENENWSKYLKLIHFNDSQNECNAHVDRHAGLMCGKIPPQSLMNVAFIAQNNGIDLVTE